jgi:hypothetical protein
MPIFPQPSAHSPLADEALHGMTLMWCSALPPLV